MPAFNFGAKVGEVISGQLARGEGGRFINAAELSVLQKQLMALILNKMKESAGVAEGPTLKEQTQKLLDKKPSKAKKQPKGKKPKAKKKKTDRASKRKETQAEKKAKKEAEQKQNRLKVSERLKDRGMDELEALANFRAGGTLSPEAQAKLIADGLVELDQDGFPRMTSLGSRLVRAANRGDEQGALDALSLAREKVAKKQDKIQENNDKIADYQNRNDILDKEIASLEDEQAGLQSELADETDPDKQAKLQAKIDRLARRIERKQATKERNQNRINSLNERSADILESLGGALLKLVKSLFIQKSGLQVADKTEREIKSLWSDFENDIKDGIEPGQAIQDLQSEFADILTNSIEEGYKAGRQAVKGNDDGGVLAEQVTNDAVDYLNNYMLQLELRLSGVTVEERLPIVQANRNRSIMYAGEPYKAYIMAKIQNAPPDSLWKWVGDIDELSCIVCREEMGKPPRLASELTRLPAVDTVCMSNCRHDIVRVK